MVGLPLCCTDSELIGGMLADPILSPFPDLLIAYLVASTMSPSAHLVLLRDEVLRQTSHSQTLWTDILWFKHMPTGLVPDLCHVWASHMPRLMNGTAHVLHICSSA